MGKQLGGTSSGFNAIASYNQGSQQIQPPWEHCGIAFLSAWHSLGERLGSHRGADWDTGALCGLWKRGTAVQDFRLVKIKQPNWRGEMRNHGKQQPSKIYRKKICLHLDISDLEYTQSVLASMLHVLLGGLQNKGTFSPHSVMNWYYGKK